MENNDLEKLAFGGSLRHCQRADLGMLLEGIMGVMGSAGGEQHGQTSDKAEPILSRVNHVSTIDALAGMIQPRGLYGSNPFHLWHREHQTSLLPLTTFDFAEMPPLCWSR